MPNKDYNILRINDDHELDFKKSYKTTLSSDIV